jgi:hypothetical protein
VPRFATWGASVHIPVFAKHVARNIGVVDAANEAHP